MATFEARQQRPLTVLLGVTGSIAAYKACELLRLLQKAGVRVKVMMTAHACELVGAATFRALSGEPVATELFENPQNPIHHLALAEEADALVIAPCSANVLNKIANGVADDLLTTTALASTAPLILAPAMNVHMLENAHTQASLAKLEAQGALIVGPGEGYLACGSAASGRMSEPEELCAATLEVLARTRSMAGRRVLITAGPTREYLDPVRFLSSPSSGRTGFALAREAAARGAEVVLVSGPVELREPSGPLITFVPVVSAEEMLRAALEHFDGTDLVIASAAVADFRPVERASHKLKKGVHLPDDTPARASAAASTAAFTPPAASAPVSAPAEPPYLLELTHNPDILATLAARRTQAASGDEDGAAPLGAPRKPFIVGFAAETEDLLAGAQRKLEAKGADLIVANDVSDPRVGFASTHNKVLLVSRDGSKETKLVSKERLATIILDHVRLAWQSGDKTTPT